MRDAKDEVQTTHKEEANARIVADKQDRVNLRQKLATCLNPLRSEEHPVSKLINIVTGEVTENKDVNVDRALEIGQRQQKDFEANYPNEFYKPLKRETVPMTANRKSIEVGDKKITDTGVFYARALALHASQREGSPSIESMLATELSPVASSMFDDRGHLRATQKSHLKRDLAVERSHRSVAKDSYFLDGCAILWAVPWPSSSNAVVQDFIDAFRAHIRRYQESADVFLIFDRYVSGSTKEMTRCARDKGLTKVFKMKLTSRLPAAKLLFSVTRNKVQIIDYIVKDLIQHKADKVNHSLIITGAEAVPYEVKGGVVIRRRDLRTAHEEADTIILHQVRTSHYKIYFCWSL